jgi:hypothetical protein
LEHPIHTLINPWIAIVRIRTFRFTGIAVGDILTTSIQINGRVRRSERSASSKIHSASRHRSSVSSGSAKLRHRVTTGPRDTSQITGIPHDRRFHTILDIHGWVRIREDRRTELDGAVKGKNKGKKRYREAHIILELNGRIQIFATRSIVNVKIMSATIHTHRVRRIACLNTRIWAAFKRRRAVINHRLTFRGIRICLGAIISEVSVDLITKSKTEKNQTLRYE